jgi:hypothetical protein
MSDSLDKQYKRIKKILGQLDKPFQESLEIYCDYLKKSLKFPCYVKGLEDFNWEEVYVWGGGPKKEYERLKEVQPSYRDSYELIDLDKDLKSKWMIDKADIVAKVRRVADNNIFYLSLSELETENKNSLNYQLLDDYSVWFVNRQDR